MRWLFRRLLSEADRLAIESDLAELYEFRRQQDGERAAARWLRRQRQWYALRLLWEHGRSAIVPDAGAGGLMSGLMSDFKQSAQSLRRSPGLAATIVLTVGLGLGATAAMVTMIDAVVLRPLPYPDQDALMWLYWRSSVVHRSESPPNLVDGGIVPHKYRLIAKRPCPFHIGGIVRSRAVLSYGAG